MIRHLGGLFGLVAIGALAGCLATAPKAPPLRDPKVSISSQVDVTAKRMAGDWVVRVSLSETARPGERLTLRAGQGGGLWLGEIALPDRGQGRFGGGGGVPEWWVLWLDAGNRTAAIGTPGGEFGWIMDRRASGGEDRIKAAKEIMQWVGYDMSRAME